MKDTESDGRSNFPLLKIPSNYAFSLILGLYLKAGITDSRNYRTSENGKASVAGVGLQLGHPRRKQCRQWD